MMPEHVLGLVLQVFCNLCVLALVYEICLKTFKFFKWACSTPNVHTHREDKDAV